MAVEQLEVRPSSRVEADKFERVLEEPLPIESAAARIEVQRSRVEVDFAVVDTESGIGVLGN